MLFDEQPLWVVALGGLAVTIVGLWIVWQIVLGLAPAWYNSMIENNSVSVDDFVGGPPHPASALKSWFLNKLNVGSRIAKKEGYALKAEDSDKVPGLKVTSRNETGKESVTSQNKDKPPPVIVGTIRMGFGHHRIAYAATSWGLGNAGDEGNIIAALMGGNKRETWFHDFLNIDSEEAQMIKDTDKLYSKGSRLASEVRCYLLRRISNLTRIMLSNFPSCSLACPLFTGLIDI